MYVLIIFRTFRHPIHILRSKEQIIGRRRTELCVSHNCSTPRLEPNTRENTETTVIHISHKLINLQMYTTCCYKLRSRMRVYIHKKQWKLLWQSVINFLILGGKRFNWSWIIQALFKEIANQENVLQRKKSIWKNNKKPIVKHCTKKTS